GALCRHVQEHAPVRNFENVCPEMPEKGGNAAEHARPVIDLNAQVDDAVLALELAIDYRGENARIDIAAAQHQADFALAEMSGVAESGGATGGPSALGLRLLVRQVSHDGALDVASADEAHIVDILLGD